MALGAVAIALSSANAREHSSWQDAAEREGERYGVEREYVRAGMQGESFGNVASGRSWVDWLVILGTTALFVALAAMASLPRMEINLGWALILAAAMLTLLTTCAVALWRTTRFR